jgi:hypothetical protein
VKKSKCKFFAVGCRTFINICDIRFVFSGLDQLISTLLMKNFHFIKQMNENGQKKMLKNLLSLCQTLVAVAPFCQDASLVKVRKFYGLYDVFGASARSGLSTNFKVEYAKQFKMNEIKSVLDLFYAEALDKKESTKFKEYTSILNQVKSIYDEMANSSSPT